MRTLRRTLLTGALWGGILGLPALPAAALDFDFSGTFQQDNDKTFFTFTVGGTGPSTVTVFSSSWLYGDPPAGAGPGGFDPMLGIWTAAGDLIAFQDDGELSGSALSNGVSYAYGVWDSYYTVDLSPGTYLTSVTQYDNFNNGNELSDGFRYDGTPNFTFAEDYGGATQPMFNGVWDFSDPDDPRTGKWAFHLVNVAGADTSDGTVVPEPSTLLLLGSGLAGLAAARRRARK